MTSKVSKNLQALSDIDKKYFAATHRRVELEQQRIAKGAELQEARRRLAECETAFKDGRLKQVLEEHRLRDEEKRIVERRKQLSSLPGAKSAKFAERELDIASRALQALEEQALKAIEETSELESQLNQLREAVAKLELDYENDAPQAERELGDLAKEIDEMRKEREGLLAGLDERLSRLYERVNNRYPGSAIAIAQSGSCRSCFRALPHQTYNQIMAGNTLIQCPGCSRIMIYAEAND